MRNRMPRPDGADGQQTIRILVFVPITLLLLTIVVFAALTGQFNDSINAYYGGPARDVFVGCLTAAALGVVAFRGCSDLEDLALNCAGFYAPIVAFVPFDFSRSAPTVRVQGEADPTLSLRVILLCYLVAAVGFVLFDYFKGPWPLGRLWQGTVGTRVLVTAALVGLAGQTMLVLIRVFEPDTRFAGLHLVAAFLLIASLIITVASHVVAPRHRGGVHDAAHRPGTGLRSLYLGLLVGRVVGGPALWYGLRAAGVSSALLWVETLELGLFMVFWGFEIRRHWTVGTYGSVPVTV
ncbi:MAG: hypothetical protein WBL05_02795 [Brooklawnia sp.]|uniref:hypothetical protein n=1 Tax=Brooklawnia sp. TaxID=2699740 RepID=UPI003C70AECF